MCNTKPEVNRSANGAIPEARGALEAVGAAFVHRLRYS
jgi:hypothetical protein